MRPHPCKGLGRRDEMVRRRALCFWIAAVTVGVCLGDAGRSRAQFISHSDRAQLTLDGNWQSCREHGGEYSERVYDGKWPGLPPFELHMGPYHDFALFRGIQDE